MDWLVKEMEMVESTHLQQALTIHRHGLIIIGRVPSPIDFRQFQTRQGGRRNYGQVLAYLQVVFGS